MRDLLEIEKLIEKFTSEGTQESLDVLCEQINLFDQRWNNTKMSVVPLIKMIAGEDIEDVDVEITDNGYRL